MTTIAISNQKGGVGKSTTCVNVAAALSRLGQRVLIVDTDPQGDSSTMCGYREIDDADVQLYDVLQKPSLIRAGVHPVELNLDIIPTDDALTDAEIELVSRKRTLLKSALRKLSDDYDYCLIDCPPSLNILTLNALIAADSVIVPVSADYLPLKGVARLIDTIEAVREAYNKRLMIGGVVLTFYNPRTNLDAEVREELERYFGEILFNTTIPRNKKLAEAPGVGTNIFSHAPKSKGAAAYMALAKEILQREE